jgi:hypothetical protein
MGMQWGSVDTRGERRSFGVAFDSPHEEITATIETKADQASRTQAVEVQERDKVREDVSLSSSLTEVIARQSEMIDKLLNAVQQQANAPAPVVDKAKHKTFAKDIKLDMPSFKDAHAKKGDGHLEVKELLDKWASAVKVKYNRHQTIDPNDPTGPNY